MLEDRLLMWKYNHGNVDVLQRIYVKYKDGLMTLATAILYDKDTAEDVVHDVFITFIRSCGKQRLTRSLKGYLATCVVNDIRNKNKAGQRHQSASLEQVAPIASDSNRPDISAAFSERFLYIHLPKILESQTKQKEVKYIFFLLRFRGP
jgi:DNA-directed RNA polymerase specialized sigma24 family protein